MRFSARSSTVASTVVATVVVALLALAGRARADEPALTVGVFTPAALADGQQRFAFAERFAAALGEKLKAKVTARNFARYADFAAAAKDPGANGLDVAVVDGWVLASAAELPLPIALGALGAEIRHRWVVVTPKAGSTRVADLAGKTVAMVRAGGSNEGRFLRNLVFDGQFDAERDLKLTLVPGVDSALRMIELGTADAAVLPAEQVSSAALKSGAMRVIFQSAPIPVAGVLALRSPTKERIASLREALASLKAAPFERFVAATSSDESGGDLGALRQIVAKGPPPRKPLLADAPPIPFEPKGLVTLRGLDTVWPFFPDIAPVAVEAPND
jgi:ABC-type phosphate/phosphonate transport system substrate-binding protein